MFLIYLKNNCPYSNNATSLLEKYKLKYHDVTVDSTSPIRLNFSREYNHTTLPVIFYYEKDIYLDKFESLPNDAIFIGGSDRLAELLDNLSKLNKTNIKETYDTKIKGIMTYKQFLKIAFELHNK